MIYFLSFFNSSNHIEYLNVIKNKLPFLFLPLSLLSVKSISRKALFYIETYFILCCLLSSFWSFYEYSKNIELYTRLYGQGRVIPTLIHHVAFAVLLCIVVLVIIKNLQSNHPKKIKLIYFLLLIWFVYFIHVLAVRTGILLLYVSILVFVIISLFTHKDKRVSLFIFLVLVVTGYISLQKIPTIKSKIAYTVYGLSQYKNNTDTINQVSDPRRILSDKIGIELLKKNKLFGVGVGDIKDEMAAIYSARYPRFKIDVYSHIHNQYLYSMCGVGLISGVIFCIFLFFPIIFFIRKKYLYFSLAYTILLLVMFWEPFLEIQTGTSIFLIVCSLGFIKEEKN